MHLRTCAAALTSTLLLFGSGCRRSAPATPHPSRPANLPRIVLWAWQEPEDLTAADPRRIGVAVLAETLFLSDHLSVEPRHQPLRLAPGTRVVTVVRIEAVRGFRDTPDLRSALAAHLASLAASHPAQAALQLDFDAVVSQYPFYTAVLRSLRPQLPPTLPLTVTALVSWCRDPSWLSSLPIDAAVPMFFRMGGPAAHTPDAPNPFHPTAAASHPPLPLPPLATPCRGTVGLSTDETWPQLPPEVTLYLFSPSPWTTDQIRILNTLDPSQLSHSATPTR